MNNQMQKKQKINPKAVPNPIKARNVAFSNDAITHETNLPNVLIFQIPSQIQLQHIIVSIVFNVLKSL